MTQAAITNTTDEAETLVVLGETLRPLLTNGMGSEIEVYDTSGDEGMGPPPHHHAWSESYFVLDGAVDVIIGDAEPIRLTAGMAAHAPSGTRHSYTIAADATRFLTILSKGNGHQFFRQMHSEISLPPNMDDLMRVTAENGITVTG